MNLIIDSSLTEPPSEVACFRDVTLFGKIFIFEDILVQCPEGTRSIYWKWLKQHGAYDYISDLVLGREKESGVMLSPSKGNITTDKICAETVGDIIKCLNIYAKLRR